MIQGTSVRGRPIVTYTLTGDPIYIERTEPVHTRPQQPTETFTVNYEDATVLARSERMVILRDPAPKPGWRSIQWNDGLQDRGSLNLRFVEVRIDSTEPSRGTPSLNVTVRGLDGMGRGRMAVMYLQNLSKSEGRLRCGSRLRATETDREEARTLTILPEAIENGRFQTKCPVDWVGRNRGPLSLETRSSWRYGVPACKRLR